MVKPYPFLAILIAASAVASPLTVYEAADLGGQGTAIPEVFTIYSGAGIPDSLDDKISSFHLDAGHMAVVSDQASGLGPGKTYIAEGQDLVIDSLPEGLDNAISFIRVVPWRTTMKKGTGGDLSANPSVDAHWWYQWGRNVASGQAIDSREYVPMSWGAGGSEEAGITDYLAMDQVTHLLGFNESDNCNDQSGQFRNLCDVPTAVGFYQDLQRAGLRLGSPATREEGAIGPNGWLAQFMTQSEAADVRIDFVAVHWYDWESSPANNPIVPASQIFRRFKRYLSNAYHRHRRPLWITEFNANPNRATNIQDAFMELALPYLESIGYVERYAWFQPFSGTGDFFEDGELTSTGQIYKDQVSTPAYVPDVLPTIWQSQDVGNVALTGKTIHANGTFTVCGAGTGIGSTSDGFHFTNTSIIGSTSVVVKVDTILQRGDSKAGLMIRETMDAGSRHASIFLTENGQARFEYRSSSGGTTEVATQNNIQAPHWLKIERQGDTFTGSYSPDGQSWTALASQSVTMAEPAQAGLAVSSQNGNNFCDTIFTSLSLSNDSDGDQLQDQWELNYFGNLTSTNGGTGDYDGDSYTDFEEYVAGTDPTDPKSFFRSIPTPAENGFLEISFTGAAGITYTLEVSESLSPESWDTINSITPISDGPQVFDYTDPSNPRSLFGRIRAER